MISDSLWAEVDAVPGWMGRSECDWLADLASRSRSWVEVGVYCGRSLLAVGLHLGTSLTPPDGLGWKPGQLRLDAVDLAMDPTMTPERLGRLVGNQQDINLGEIGRVLPVVLDLIRRRRPAVSLACWGLASELAARVVPDANVVFLDASHNRDAVRADILAWRGKCRTLAGHDFQPNWRGVVDAVTELCPGATNPVDAVWTWGPEEGKT